MNRALLVGKEPGYPLGYEYVTAAPYSCVVIGSLEVGELLRFRNERVLEALCQGMPVILYTPGLPQPGKNRALGAALASARRELKTWGVVFTDGGRKRLITAQEAREMKLAGRTPGPGAVLTPLAREIMEGKQ